MDPLVPGRLVPWFQELERGPQLEKQFLVSGNISEDPSGLLMWSWSLLGVAASHQGAAEAEFTPAPAPPLSQE